MILTDEKWDSELSNLTKTVGRLANWLIASTQLTARGRHCRKSNYHFNKLNFSMSTLAVFL